MSKTPGPKPRLSALGFDNTHSPRTTAEDLGYIMPPDQGTLAPPIDLSKEAMSVWEQLIPDLAKSGILRSSDALMLAELCESIVIAQTFRRQMSVLTTQMDLATNDGDLDKIIALSGIVKRIRSGYFEALRAMQSLAAEFGIAPVARIRLKLGVDENKGLLDLLNDAPD